jgi:hypothetical protein
MEVLILGSLLSLMICTGALALEWRQLVTKPRSPIAFEPDEN